MNNCLPGSDVADGCSSEEGGRHLLLVEMMYRNISRESPERCKEEQDQVAMMWQDFLLRYGAHSEQLRDAVAELAGPPANTIVHWEC